MERIRKCTTCKKILNQFKCESIPIYSPPSREFPMPSGGALLYCTACYKDEIGETFNEETKNKKIFKE